MPPKDVTPGSRSASRAARVLAWILICSPVLVYLTQLQDFGELQGNDYYAIVKLVIDGDGLSTNPFLWLDLKSNEHRVMLPSLVYVLNMVLTQGNNLGLSLAALLLLTLSLVLMIRQLPTDISSSLILRTLFGFAMALFCFTPVAVHSVAMGFSGTIWFFGNALAVAAFTTLAGRSGVPGPGKLRWVLLFGLAAAFSHSTHLALWPALLAGAIFLRLRLRQTVLVAIGMTFVLSLYATTYRSLDAHPSPNTRRTEVLVDYTSNYLGSLFSEDPEMAKALGLAGIVVCLLGCAVGFVWSLIGSRDLQRKDASGKAASGKAASGKDASGKDASGKDLLRKDALRKDALRKDALRKDLAPWLMLQLYGLGNASLTAIARSGFGEEQATASRYASVAAMFWIGLLTSIGILAWRFRPAPRLPKIAVAILCLALVGGSGIAMHVRAEPLMDRFLGRGSRQRVAALALTQGIRDDKILSRAVTPAPAQVWAIYEYLRASGHVPFDKDPVWRLDKQFPASLFSPRPHPLVNSKLDRLESFPDRYVRVTGWAFSSEVEIVDVRIFGYEGLMKGEIFTHIRRPELARWIDERSAWSGWEGYAQIDRTKPGLKAYVRVAGDPLFYPIPTSGRVQGQLRAYE